MRDSIQQKIATANNLWEAKYIYGKIFGHIYDESGASYTNQAYRQLENSFNKSLTWNNIIISSNKFESLHVYDADLGKVTNHRVVNPVFSYFQISQKGIMKHSQNAYTANNLQCNPKYKIVINDIVNKKTINKSAIRYYLDNNKDVKILYYLNFNTEIAKSTWFKDLQFETVPLTLMSDLVNEYVKNKPKVVRSKVPKELTKIGYVNIPTFYRSGNFTQYETIDLNAVNGVYVYSEDRVVDINGRKINLVYFLEDLKNLNNIFNMGLDKVYLMGPRIKDGKKFNSQNWTNIETIINKSANANNSIANYIEHTAYNNSINSTRGNSNTKYLILSKSMMQSIAPNIKNPNGPVNKICAS
jgi:hypothetical protein